MCALSEFFYVKIVQKVHNNEEKEKKVYTLQQTQKLNNKIHFITTY